MHPPRSEPLLAWQPSLFLLIHDPVDLTLVRIKLAASPMRPEALYRYIEVIHPGILARCLPVDVQSRGYRAYRFALAHLLDGCYLFHPEHSPCSSLSGGVLWNTHLISSAPSSIICFSIHYLPLEILTIFLGILRLLQTP